MNPANPSPKSIAFFGASNGVCHATLLASLAAGHNCLALCRDPSKLEHLCPQYPHTLIIHHGNAHNVTDVLTCLTMPRSGRLVDAIHFSIGNKPDLKKMSEGDPRVCQTGMATRLQALAILRRDWAVQGSPLLCVASTTGISDRRDIPLLFYPLYHFMLAVPHKDKKIMEGLLVESEERFVLVRPSLLWDGEDKGRAVRVGVADARTGVVQKREVGYTISRAAVGGWMFENLIQRVWERGCLRGRLFL
ncbi:NAD(P)-binding protein [Aspergillus granulosus]|uniref:NAD(P)-binding protein n=1 Tax=Aspergillus granulosus TaxID=176169 RepID=A0ABR4GS34_9EURO